MNAPRVLAMQDVDVTGPHGTVKATAEAVQSPQGQIHYRIPALGLDLTEEEATHLAGGIADITGVAHGIRPHTLTIE